MTDYPNMSYCMNSNTLLALNQIIDAMNEQGSRFYQELSKDEARAFADLFNACQDFIAKAEDVFESRYDGQPDEAQEWADFDSDC